MITNLAPNVTSLHTLTHPINSMKSRCNTISTVHAQEHFHAWMRRERTSTLTSASIKLNKAQVHGQMVHLSGVLESTNGQPCAVLADLWVSIPGGGRGWEGGYGRFVGLPSGLVGADCFELTMWGTPIPESAQMDVAVNAFVHRWMINPLRP